MFHISIDWMQSLSMLGRVSLAAVLSVTAVSRGAGWNFVTVFPAVIPAPASHLVRGAWATR